MTRRLPGFLVGQSKGYLFDGRCQSCARRGHIDLVGRHAVRLSVQNGGAHVLLTLPRDLVLKYQQQAAQALSAFDEPSESCTKSGLRSCSTVMSVVARIARVMTMKPATISIARL